MPNLVWNKDKKCIYDGWKFGWFIHLKFQWRNSVLEWWCFNSSCHLIWFVWWWIWDLRSLCSVSCLGVLKHQTKWFGWEVILKIMKKWWSWWCCMFDLCLYVKSYVGWLSLVTWWIFITPSVPKYKTTLGKLISS